MSFDIMLKVTKHVNDLLHSPGADGIVIPNGTDTMEETSSFLDLTVNDEPVSWSDPCGRLRHQCNGPLNFYDAVSVTADPNTRAAASWS